MIYSIGAFASGAIVGVLAGLIGLGGAEFRLPLLVGVFGHSVLKAVVINLLVSLITVSCSLVFRFRSIPLEQITNH